MLPCVSLALRHDGDPVCEQIGLIHVVRRQHEHTAGLGTAKELPEGAARGRIHAGGRLIEEDRLWWCCGVRLIWAMDEGAVGREWKLQQLLQ